MFEFQKWKLLSHDDSRLNCFNQVVRVCCLLLVVWGAATHLKATYADDWDELETRTAWFNEQIAVHWAPKDVDTDNTTPMPFLHNHVPRSSKDTEVEEVNTDEEDETFIDKTLSYAKINAEIQDRGQSSQRPLCNGKCKRAAVVQMTSNTRSGQNEIDLLQGVTGPFFHRPDCHLFHVRSC